LPVTDERLAFRNRVNPTDIPADVRRKSFVEMELCLNEVDAMKEAQRCLRCDLEFTKPK
jgi:hypothetical protein